MSQNTTYFVPVYKNCTSEFPKTKLFRRQEDKTKAIYKNNNNKNSLYIKTMGNFVEPR
jgi:hypothetical protein